MELRPYQIEAVAALLNHDYALGNPVAALPTGTGKSFVIADIVTHVLHDNPKARILIATHTQDIIQQNYDEFIDAYGSHGSIGIYSAGIGRKEAHTQIMFCGIQSVFRQVDIINKCDVLIIDECHTVPRNADTMWRKFIAQLHQRNPHMVCMGLSATPFRLDSGLVTDGKDALFSTIVYEYTLLDAIKQGYLVKPIVPPTEIRLSTEGVGKRGGEFIAGQLEKAVDDDKITALAMDELFFFGANRKTWLVFGAGIKHCNHLAVHIRNRGKECAVLTNETPKDEARSIKQRYKQGDLDCIVSTRMMTTGTNIPRIDLIADFYPTESAGLHIQKIGRGLRLYPQGSKTDCMVLDFAGNTRRHGPLDQINVLAYKEKVPGDAPVKVCPPPCHSIVFAGTRICPYCGYNFPMESMPTIEASADRAGLLSEDQNKPKWLTVHKVRYEKYVKDKNKPATLKVTYYCLGELPVYEFVCLDHALGSFPKQKAIQWGLYRGMVSTSVEAALDHDWPKIRRIEVYKNGKYWNIKNVELSA